MKTEWQLQLGGTQTQSLAGRQPVHMLVLVYQLGAHQAMDENKGHRITDRTMRDGQMILLAGPQAENQTGYIKKFIKIENESHGMVSVVGLWMVLSRHDRAACILHDPLHTLDRKAKALPLATEFRLMSSMFILSGLPVVIKT